MTKIEGIKKWSDVPVLEDGDILKGGVDGLANVQAKALVDRTEYLKEELLEVKEQTAGLGPNMGSGTEGGGGNLPAGTIIAFGGTTVPAGFLECNGATLSRTTFAGLFAAIGTVWGEPSPTTFKIPNFTEAERFLRSRSETLKVGTVQGDAIRNITGTMRAYSSLSPTTTGAIYTSTDYQARIGAANGTGPDKMHFDASLVVPTAGENRPKSAVVMYCIKVSDSVLNPEQLLAQGVVGDVANKADRTEIRELAGTRFHMSGEHTPVLNYMTNWNHNRNIDPLYYKCDVLLKCIVDDSITGFLKGDIVSGVMPTRTTDGGTVGYGLVPILYSNTIQLFTGSAGLIFPKKNGGFVAVSSFTNWRYIFRIWY